MISMTQLKLLQLMSWDEYSLEGYNVYGDKTFTITSFDMRVLHVAGQL